MRNTLSWRAAAASAAAALALTACGTTEDTETAAESPGTEESCSATVAFLGPLTGDYANLGLNIVNGAKLALDQYEGDCDVELKEFDSQGDPEQAGPLAAEIIGDEDVIGLIGPTFSGETDTTGQDFADAGLVTVSPSATRPDLSSNGWDTFHRLLGNDDLQAPAAAKYIAEDLGAERVFVIDDATDYGTALSEGVEEALGDLVVDTDTVALKQTDFQATITAIDSAEADAVWYGGYYAEAGLLLKQLRAAGFEGDFVSGDGSNDPGLIAASGAEAAEGAYLTCPCGPASEEFSAAYEEIADQAPGTYSGEGFDAMNIFLQGLDDGVADREGMLEWVNTYDAQGETRPIKFAENGEVEADEVFIYTVEDGTIVGGDPIE